MASQKKSHVFRVTGLSRELPDGDLATALQEAINDNFTDDERSCIAAEITIVPSCYESDKERMALVQFRGGMPDFLSELRVNPLGDWQVEIGDNDINFDCHFFGFTQLYAPVEYEPVIADIIAITGLDGHAYGSWQGRGNLGRMWLRDFLSKDLPQCRTLIYGYNSKLSSHGVDTILDYGRELMEEIKKIRNTEQLQQRPLIFIAHSFGGIILAHCLVRAIQTMEEDHPAITSLHRATYGFILFAIPHKGLVMDDIQQMLAGDKSHPREQLLRQISSQSDLLINQLADFKNLIRDRKVVSFYETEQTRRLVLDSESGRWKRTGDIMTTVGADSALLQLPDYIEDKVPLHVDHSMIVKFNARNVAGYRTTLERLQQFSKDAPSVVAARFLQTRPPRSTVPFKKDPIFVGREPMINTIKEKHGAIGQHHKRVALVGLAGVGKTQTAIEYSYRVRESIPNTWIFWIHASNAARFEQGYQQIAAVVEIPGRDDPEKNILQLVYEWLCDPRNGRWLIVLDNADDDSIFFGVDKSNERGPLASFLPQAARGSMLITSRNELAARNLVGSDGHVIMVEPMNEEDSLALLQARIPNLQSGPSGEDEKALVQALEYIPLAITQAGSYIANRSPRVTVSRYLQLFRESESNQAHLLQYEDAKDIRRDPSIRYAVVTTWQLSFEQIHQDQPAATELLALMSMFDRQGIPEGLVRGDSDELQFEDTVAPLISYSLVRVEIETASFDMHRLVQLSVRAWLEFHFELARWQEKSRAIMADIFPGGEYESWAECQQLLPHAKEVTKSISDGHDDRLHAATILSSCGTYLRHRGIYEEAEAMEQRALKIFEEVLGCEHRYTLNSFTGLGNVLLGQGKYEGAEMMYRQALEGSEKVLGREHPGTLMVVNNLGNLFSSQGKYKEAEMMYRQALEGSEKVLGHEHPGTLPSIENLGSVLSSQGKHEEAEAMHRKALKGKEKVLGSEHPGTLSNINNLGLVLSSQKKYEEAEAMHRKALKGKEKVLGSEHPDTLSSINNLASVLFKQMKYGEAEAMQRRVVEGREKVLGREHPDTLSSLSNLGLMLSAQEKHEDAQAMHRMALEESKKVLGHEHPDTVRHKMNLAISRYDQLYPLSPTGSCSHEENEELSPPSIIEHSTAYLSPYGVRTEDVMVPQPGMQAISNSSTALYLISESLPANVMILELNITSHDQGFCHDPSRGSWTWFEVSIIRPWCEQPDNDFEDLKHNAVLKSYPKDFGDSIQERGWYFANIPIPDESGGTNTDPISRKVLDNPVSRRWSVNRVSWSTGDLGGDFVSLLQEGDRLLIWARAQYPGWVNYVRQVQVALKTADSIDVKQEDTPLPTVNTGIHMQQEILPRNIFSTPHPLLQMSQTHPQSLEEKEDRDVD